LPSAKCFNFKNRGGIKMKVNQVTVPEPKNRQAALNISAYHIQQKDNVKRRRENLMKNITYTELKLKRLELTLENYKKQLDELKKIDSCTDSALKKIQGAFDLTMAEILETKSALLRNQIITLQKQAGVEVKETDFR
jgi:hypothetical protein